MFGYHGLCGLLEEGAHGKSPKCLSGNLGDFTKGSGRLKTGKPIFRRPFMLSLLSKLIHKIIEVVMRFGSCLNLLIDGLTNPPTAQQRFENSSKPLRYFQ